MSDKSKILRDLPQGKIKVLRDLPEGERKYLKKKKKKKMPKARDMAMGDKNISYVGDPFIVDGEIFDPAKKFPETYMRPEGKKNFMCGGEVRGGGAAIRGKGFKGVF